jgi:hypothetical protein
MARRRNVCARLALGLGWLVLAAGPASAQSSPRDEPPAFGPAHVPLEDVPEAMRPRVAAVLDRPTFRLRGPVEAFTCRPAFYYWLLDHPDQGVRLWRWLGAKCSDILPEGGDRFVWKDPQGGEVHWDTALRAPGRRVWYAEGEIKPGLLLPTIPIQAVVVLQYGEGKDVEGRPAVRHQAEVILHTDSRAAALATRLLGASAPRTARESVGQIGMFYAALSWYLDQHPQQAAALLERLKRPETNGKPEPRNKE